jgi:NAD(P)-dependent dehydrogenase (short-subunit alcohol dehydrogenase family)
MSPGARARGPAGSGVPRRARPGDTGATAGTPEEVAAAICFLAGPDAGYISGATLDVNGGRFMG